MSVSTAQGAVNNWRIQIGETDSANSRWTDAQGLFYYNQGRRKFSEESKSVRAEFQRTTSVGKTLGNEYARYSLDPSVLEIDDVVWDGFVLSDTGYHFDRSISGLDKSSLGVPHMYRRIGDSLDLFYAPDKAALLQIFASTLTTDLAALTSAESELKQDQIQASIDYATAMALADDDRDGSFYISKFNASVRKNLKRFNHGGPRFVNAIDNIDA